MLPHVFFRSKSSPWSPNRINKSVKMEDNKYKILRAPQYQHARERLFQTAVYYSLSSAIQMIPRNRPWYCMYTGKSRRTRRKKKRVRRREKNAKERKENIHCPSIFVRNVCQLRFSPLWRIEVDVPAVRTITPTCH